MRKPAPSPLLIRLSQAAFKVSSDADGRVRHETARLLSDPETGLDVMYVRYPAGSVTRRHIHPCAHGLLVIDGVLETESGRFGPGDLVWYPQDAVGEHGATMDGPVTVLLFTNKPFGIAYLDADKA